MSLAIVLPGRGGDICNILAVCRHLHSQGNQVHFVVNHQYRQILCGVSYVVPHSVHFPMERIEQAVDYAKSRYDKVINCVTWGKSWKGDKTKPFNLLSWLETGFTEAEFYNTKDFPLVFDRRDVGRENFVYTRNVKSNRPLILVNVGCGKSSPFASHHVFTQAIRRQWGNYSEILNLCAVKASSLYDMLGLFDRARLLITGDTSALHLATASAVPVIALVNDKPFLASATRYPCVLKLPYRDWLKNMKAIHAAIGGLLSQPERRAASTGSELES